MNSPVRKFHKSNGITLSYLEIINPAAANKTTLVVLPQGLRDAVYMTDVATFQGLSVHKIIFLDMLGRGESTNLSDLPKIELAECSRIYSDFCVAAFEGADQIICLAKSFGTNYLMHLLQSYSADELKIDHAIIIAGPTFTKRQKKWLNYLVGLYFKIKTVNFLVRAFFWINKRIGLKHIDFSYVNWRSADAWHDYRLISSYKLVAKSLAANTHFVLNAKDELVTEEVRIQIRQLAPAENFYTLSTQSHFGALTEDEIQVVQSLIMKLA